MRAHPFVWLPAAAVAVAAALVALGASADAGEPALRVTRSDAARAVGATATAPVAEAHATTAMRAVLESTADASMTTRPGTLAPNAPTPPTIRQVLVVDAFGRPQPDVALGLHAADVRTGLLRTLPLGTTANDGSFPFAAGRAGLLVAEAPGGRIGERLVHADEAAPRLVLQATGAIAVLVTDVAGRPVADAEVVLSDSSCRHAGRSDAQGRAFFPRIAPNAELELRATAHGRRSLTTIAAGRAVGRTLEPVVVLTDECAQVRTALVDTSGRALPHTCVRCTFADDSSTRATSDDFGGLCIDLPPAFAAEPGTIRCERLDAGGHLDGAAVAITLPPAAGRVHAAPPIRLPVPHAAEDAPSSAFEFATRRTRVSSRP